MTRSRFSCTSSTSTVRIGIPYEFAFSSIVLCNFDSSSVVICANSWRPIDSPCAAIAMASLNSSTSKAAFLPIPNHPEIHRAHAHLHRVFRQCRLGLHIPHADALVRRRAHRKLQMRPGQSTKKNRPLRMQQVNADKAHHDARREQRCPPRGQWPYSTVVFSLGIPLGHLFRTGQGILDPEKERAGALQWLRPDECSGAL